MTPRIQDVDHPPTARRGRRATAVALMAVAVGLAACSSGSSTGSTSTTAGASTTAVLVKPPDLALQGCNYVINGSVPAGEPSGIQPPFTLSGPNAAGQAALAHIAAHGGTGLVNGYLLPSGTKLYAGPDQGSAPVATISAARSLFVADPVLWTTGSGAQWLASFVACGGSGLYWIDVAQVTAVNKSVGLGITKSIATLKAAAPYPGSGTPSALPITINAKKQFAWVNPAVTFAVGRGQYLGF